MAKSSATTMPKTPSLKKEFLLFISIPLGIVLIVAAVVIIPSLFAKPKYDFIYSFCPSYNCSSNLTVNHAGKVIETPTTSDTYTTYAVPELYYYSASQNASKKIEIADASFYKLDALNVSPDGYKLSQSDTSGGGFLLFGSSGDYNWYLKNGLKKKQVNLTTNNVYDSTAVTLLGWVVK